MNEIRGEIHEASGNVGFKYDPHYTLCTLRHDPIVRLTPCLANNR